MNSIKDHWELYLNALPMDMTTAEIVDRKLTFYEGANAMLLIMCKAQSTLVTEVEKEVLQLAEHSKHEYS